MLATGGYLSSQYDAVSIPQLPAIQISSVESAVTGTLAASVETTSFSNFGTYYAGDVIPLNITVTYANVCGPSTLQLTPSVQTPGFQVVKYSPSPLVVSQSNQTNIVVYVSGPSSGFSGSVSVNLRAQLASPNQKTSYCSVQINQVALYNDGTTNHYILNVTASNLGNQTWNFNPFNLQVVSSSSGVYSSGFTSAIIQQLTSASLGKGQHVTGQVDFDMTGNEHPATLEYNDSLAGVSTQAAIPAVSSWVSYLTSVGVTIQGQGSLSVNAFGSVTGTQLYYYSGEEINVTISLNYYADTYAGDPASISVTSATNTGPFTVLSVTPNFPVSVNGDDSTVTLTIVLEAPSQSFSGPTLNFVLNVSQ
jgi:hypothetical protein